MDKGGMMDRGEKVFDAIGKAQTQSKEAYEKFWVYEQDMIRRLKAGHERIAKLEEEKAQLEEKVKVMIGKANHEASGTSLWLQMKENDKLRGENVHMAVEIRELEQRLVTQTDMRAAEEQKVRELIVEVENWRRALEAANSRCEALKTEAVKVADFRPQPGALKKEIEELKATAKYWLESTRIWQSNFDKEHERCEGLESKFQYWKGEALRRQQLLEEAIQKASQPTTTESEWKLRLAEMNALREAEQEKRLATESELERFKKSLSGCKEQMLILAGVMGKV